MNIFDFAITMEKEGEEYYRELAGKVSSEGMQKILTMLADDEVKHWRVFEKMKNNESAGIIETQVLQEAKNIFSRMKEDKVDLTAGSVQVDLYKKAQDLEAKSESFYREKAAAADNDGQKEILLQIADEEKKHFHLLRNIIEFVSRPTQWLENSEFYHIDEY
jgi:rubrerythrin